MATPERARMAHARGTVPVQKCSGDPRHWFAPTAPAGRVVDACTTRCVDFYGHIHLWPLQYAHEWPVHAARLGCRNVGGTPDIGLHPPSPLVASWTHPLLGVWTSMATYIYGQSNTRTNGHCTRRGSAADVFGGPPKLIFTHDARWSCRGCTHHPVCGLRWPHTSLATPVRARMANARGAISMLKRSRAPRHCLEPITPAVRVVDARTTRSVDFYGHIHLWPLQCAHE